MTQQTNGIKELTKYVFQAKYAKYLPEEKRKETWKESVKRVKDMMLKKYEDYPEVHEEIEWAYSLMEKKRVLGSQRNLNFGGGAVFDHNAKSFNCCYSPINRPEFFQECFYLLLCGCGVGFSVQHHHVNKLSHIVDRNLEPKTLIVGDSIEGWADAVGVLLSSFLDVGTFSEWKHVPVKFDYNQIRPKGSPVSFGGTAPGPDGLQNSLEKIEALLSKKQTGEKLSTLECHDIVCHISDAVLSGGHRRSALISIFSSNDEKMIKCKTGNWFVENPQRARANNSGLLLRGKVTFEEYQKIMFYTKEYGEPGTIWADDEEYGVNPCTLGSNKVVTREGEVKVEDLKVGDKIWSKEGWTTVTNIWSNGTKPVFRYHIDKFFQESSDYIDLTSDHKIVIDGGLKVEIALSNSIENLPGPDSDGEIDSVSCKIIKSEPLGPQEVFDITVDNSSHTFMCNGFNIHNCCEASFFPYTEDGICSWQFCNLSTINSSNLKDEDDFLERVKAATIIGTLQAGFTSFPYLGKAAEEITKREALLGVSMTGIMDKPEITLNPKVLKKGAEHAKKINKAFAAKIGINQSARITLIKPEGSSSAMLGTSSGVHPHHSSRYIRRVQANTTEEVYNHFASINGFACEKSVWSANGTDDVINFPIEVPKGAKLKNQIPALELLEAVKTLQINWVQNGRNKDLCVRPWLQHNVSNTITCKEHEWEDVIKYIYDNQEYFCGVSLVSDSSDKSYQQAPFTTVHTPYEIAQIYGDASLWCSGLIELAQQTFSNNLWKACDAALGIGFNQTKVEEERNKVHCALKAGRDEEGELYVFNKGEFLRNKRCEQLWDKQLELDSKLDFCNRMRKFADKYMDGNLRQLTYLMKDVYNWKLYTDLVKNFREVDYSNMVIENGHNNFELEAACAGGACEVL